MALKVLILAAVAAGLAQAGRDEGGVIQARGMDEGPWSMMNQQPEVLIVKEKGGPPANGGTMGMSMKDLTPLLCLLAPLLLAAIMIPAKMTMMMNNMMGNGGGGMFPMLPMIPMLPNGMLPMFPGGVFPGGMLPGGMLPGGMLPGLPGIIPGRLRVTDLLSSGSSSSNVVAGKEFVDGNKNATVDSYDDCKEREGCKKGPLSYILSAKEALMKRKMQTSGGHLKETRDWSSRVWSDRKNQASLANEIL
ncbi:hypothetical protein AVEN_83336-1, partial [Araneus ventricosus]